MLIAMIMKEMALDNSKPYYNIAWYSTQILADLFLPVERSLAEKVEVVLVWDDSQKHFMSVL